MWLCHSNNNYIDFEIKTAACFAKAELEDFEANTANEKLGSGEYHYAQAIGIENEDGTFDPLPSRSEALASL